MTDMDAEIESVRNSMGFRNDGKYWFMKKGLGVFKDGKTMRNSIPTDLDPSDRVPEDVAAERRRVAAERLINIDEMESESRIRTGKTIMIVAAIYAAYVSIFVDTGDALGHLVRFSAFPLVSTGYGFYVSGQRSL